MTFLLWQISSVTSKHNRKSNYLKVVENEEEEFYSIGISLSEQEIYKRKCPFSSLVGWEKLQKLQSDGIFKKKQWQAFCPCQSEY